jgi:hypothetical protein
MVLCMRRRFFVAYHVETRVVNAHLKFSVGPGDDNRVVQPSRVVDLSHEANVEKLLEFFTDEVLSGLLLGPLLHQRGIGVDLQMVLNHLPSDLRHL